MKQKKKLLTSTALSLILMSQTSLVAFAADKPLAEGSAENIVWYEMPADEFMDYSNVGAVEAVITTTSDYVNGTVGVTDFNGEWVTAGQLEASAGTTTWRLDGLSGILAINGETVVHVQTWTVNSGSYSIDSVTFYDTDGKVIEPSDTPVERPDIKLPDAQRADIDNNAFAYPGIIDVEKAVGSDFGTIGAIDVTFKWGSTDDSWNGGASFGGACRKDGSNISWLSSEEYGNVNANEDKYGDKTEATFRVFDFGDNPVTELTATGITGEIAGYATLDFGEWWRSDNANPQISKITFYNADGKELTSLNYTTDYDADIAETIEPSEETEQTPEPAENSVSDIAGIPDVTPEKGSPDTGIGGLAAALGLTAVSVTTAIFARKKR